MKTKILLLATVITIIFFSCKKEESTDPEITTTFELSENQAVGDYITDDLNGVFFEVSIENGLMRNGEAAQTNNILSCASVNISPLSGWPKTIEIDFGSGCTAFGITRSGKVTIVLSDSVHVSGTTAVMTFDNYKVQNFKLEGTITWTNTSSGQSISWSREIEDGKVTAPGGYYWLHTGSKSVTQTSGAATPLNLLDDVFSVTGNHTVTNPQGKSRIASVVEALIVKTICSNVTKGKVMIQGPNHYAVIDYGDGSCDRVATISIDGHAPHTILLP